MAVPAQPGGGFGSSGSFQYRVSDGKAWSPPVTVTLTIAGNAETDPVANSATHAHAHPAAAAEPAAAVDPVAEPATVDDPPPSVPGLLPTPRPTPAPSTPDPQESARPTPEPSTRPSPSASPDRATPLPGVIPPITGPGGGNGPDGQPQPGLRLPSRDGIDLGLDLGDLGTIGGFDTWAVPAATVGGAGLLVLLFVGSTGRRDGGLGAGRAALARRAESAAPSPALSQRSGVSRSASAGPRPPAACGHRP